MFIIRLSSGRTIQLRERVKLSAEEIGGLGSGTRASTVAEVSRNPNEPAMLGRWVEPGRSIKLAIGTTIDFGSIREEIRVEAGVSALVDRLRDLYQVRLGPGSLQVATDDDFTCLGKLVVLEVPQPSDRVIASVGDGEIGGALIFPQDQRQESRLVIFRLSTLPLLLQQLRTQLTKYLTSQAVFSWPWKA